MTQSFCNLCPRNCMIDRSARQGYCRASDVPRVAHAGLHLWEEPPISGTRGSGTIFFSGCNLSCVYCQNHSISTHPECGKAADATELAQIMLRLEQAGAHNINFVTPTPHIPAIIEGVSRAKREGLSLPIVYNTNAYETVESIRSLEGIVDIYLPDMKYSSDEAAQRYSDAPGYVNIAAAAIEEIYRQTGTLVIQDGLAVRGVLVRHLVLPCMLEETRGVLDILGELLPRTSSISLMRQYVPLGKAADYPEINRKITAREYHRAVEYAGLQGWENIYTQEDSSADAAFVPVWNML